MSRQRAFGLALLFVPFALGGVGAGDAKFFAAAGAYLGPTLTLHAFLFGTILGGPLALALWGRALVRRVAATGGPHAWAGAIAAGAQAGAPRVTLPYTVPLALGVVTALAVDAAGLSLFEGFHLPGFY